MKFRIFLLSLALMVLCAAMQAQPNGTNYVRQSDFGDGQNNSFPSVSGDWMYLNFWNNVQILGTQSNWFGPNYAPLGPSTSHPHYVMLDDGPNDFGALAGRLTDLEYRLVEVNFDYITYNERGNTKNTTDGKLHVLLCTNENDVKSFDPNNPSLFETSGLGQVLMTINFLGQPTSGLDLNNWTPTTSAASRRKYVLSKSQTGTPGNPCTYVGLVWESEFNETRLLLDNFRIVDICPDCEFLNPNIPTSGCFDNNWISPIPNNYYYYSATIRDAGTNGLIYSAIHRPARFSWDGTGNTGTWNGVQVPYGLAMKAQITYYSCYRGKANIETLNFDVVRTQGCIDLPFGGNKTLRTFPDFVVSPSVTTSEAIVNIHTSRSFASSSEVKLSDWAGRTLTSWPLNTQSINGTGQEIRLPILSNGLYLIQLEAEGSKLAQKILIQ